jgi:hypothetical protein
MTPIPKGFEKIIEQAHKDGVRFTFDVNCNAIKCPNLAEYEQPMVFNDSRKKFVLNLCYAHQVMLDNDEEFEAKVNN